MSTSTIEPTTNTTPTVDNPAWYPLTVDVAPCRRQDIWVAPERISGAGTGTRENPLDGGTPEKLDAILGSLPNHCTLHLLPGTFTTFGSLGQNPLPDNLIIQGAGMDLTTLFLNPYPADQVPQPTQSNSDPQPARLSFFRQTSNPTRLEVRDLTLDGNIQNQPSRSMVQGTAECTTGGFYRVHLTNWGDTPAIAVNWECFGLVLGGSGPTGYYEILHCVVDAPAGDNSSNYSYASELGINAGGSDPDASHPTKVGGLIFGNRVMGEPRCYGISLAGRFDGLKVLCNTVHGAARGFHQDTIFNPFDTPSGPMYSRNVTIAYNTFDSCYTGIGISGVLGAGGYAEAGLYNYVSSHNEIRGATDSSGVNVYGQFYNLFLGGNVHGFHSDHDHFTGQALSCFGFDGTNNSYSVTNLRVANGLATGGVSGTPLYINDNRYEDGTPLPYYGEHSTREIFSARKEGSSAVRQKLVLTFSEKNEYISSWPSYEVHMLQRGANDGSPAAEAVLRVTASKHYHTGIFINVTQLSGAPVNVALGGNAGGTVAAPEDYIISATATLALLPPGADNLPASFTVTALGVPATGTSDQHPLMTCALLDEDRSSLVSNVAAPGRVKQTALTSPSSITSDMGSIYLLTSGTYTLYAATSEVAGTVQRFINASSGAVTISAPSGTNILGAGGQNSALTIPVYGNVTLEAAPANQTRLFLVVAKNY